MALNPFRRIFLNFAKSQFDNEKWRSPSSFLSYKRLKLKLRVFLTGHIVTMVTYCARQLTATRSPLIGQFVDTMIWHQPIKRGFNGSSNCKSWKVLETVSSHLNLSPLGDLESHLRKLGCTPGNKIYYLKHFRSKISHTYHKCNCLRNAYCCFVTRATLTQL